MRVCLMIEGQESVTWDQWVAIARACEDSGFEGLFRSDHYVSVEGRTGRSSLDAWTTIGALAAVTERIRLGTLVSPATFRHPSVLAKSVVTADHVSGGRIELGLGAGWNELEHRAYGFPFADLRTRMDVMAEQLEIIARSFEDEPFSFDGQHYKVEDLNAQPKPVQRPRLPIVMGGSAGPRSLKLAAQWADEYNTVFATPELVAERSGKFARAWEQAGRDPDKLVFSVMTAVLVGSDEADLRAWAERLAAQRGVDVDQMLDGIRDNAVVGTIDQAAERLREYEQAGASRIMLQHHLHDDLEAVELIGRELIPRVA
jgi:F420-dependent oxidoreductase-like protein